MPDYRLAEDKFDLLIVFFNQERYDSSHRCIVIRQQCKRPWYHNSLFVNQCCLLWTNSKKNPLFSEPKQQFEVVNVGKIKLKDFLTWLIYFYLFILFFDKFEVYRRVSLVSEGRRLQKAAQTVNSLSARGTSGIGRFFYGFIFEVDFLSLIAIPVF